MRRRALALVGFLVVVGGFVAGLILLGVGAALTLRRRVSQPQLRF